MTDRASLEDRLGINGLSSLIRDNVKPVLETLPGDQGRESMAAAMKRFQRSMTIAFFSFGASFFLFATFVPDNAWTIPLKFMVFIFGFFGFLAFAAWLNRDAISVLILRTQENFVARSAALTELSKAAGLNFIPAPGGAPASLKALAKLGFLKTQTRKIIEMLDSHGGMHETVEAALQSGLLSTGILVIGTKKQREAYYRGDLGGQTFEDGFQGVRSGVAFSALEWVEKVEDSPDRYHLIFVLNAPYRLSGVTQLRSRNTPWPANVQDTTLSDIQVLPAEFNEKFRLRGSDQVEARSIFNPAVIERVLALAHDDSFRAVASGQHLVLDIIGENRFNLVDLTTGEWGDDSISRTLTDMAELLELTDALAHAFMVRK